jgi:hypothetical protein
MYLNVIWNLFSFILFFEFNFLKICFSFVLFISIHNIWVCWCWLIFFNSFAILEGGRLIDYLQFYVPLIWRHHHCRWRGAKLRPMLCAQGLWAGRDLYRATPTVTRGLGFSGLILRTAPSSRLLRHAWECGGSILVRILTVFASFI